MAKRGQLNVVVVEVSRKFLGETMTTTELRLIPYLQYVMVNEQKLDPRKINEDERIILSKWKTRGLLEGGAGGMTITKEFWQFMCDILLVAYVDHDSYEAVKDITRTESEDA